MFTVTVKYFMKDTVRWITDAQGIGEALALLNLAQVASVTIENDSKD